MQEISVLNNKYLSDIHVKNIKRLLLLGYFFSMQPWFFYGTWVKGHIYTFLIVILLLPFLKYKYIFSELTVFKKKDAIMLSLSFIIYGISNGINSTLGFLPVIVFILFYFRIEDSIKIDVINYITKYLSIFIGVSLVVHIIYLSTRFNTTFFYPNDGSYPGGFNQMYINIVSSWMPYIRFQSVFIEPGHLIVGIFPLLLINKFNLRNKYVFILFVALLFSLSLAGYLYTLISFIYFSITQKKIIRLFVFTIVTSLIVYITYSYMENNEDSPLSLAIASRLIIEDDGDFSGNNRVTEYTDNIYKKVCDSSDVFWGTSRYDKNLKDEGNNGYKIIVVRSGVIPLFFLLLAILLQNRLYMSKDSSFVILMFIIMNSQNFYPYWICSIIILLTGPYYIFKTNNNINKLS